MLRAVSELEGFAFETTDIDLGGERYLKTGHILSDEDIEQLRGYDAIMLGAIGHPDVKPGVLEKGLLLNLRFKMDQYINLRPVKLYPGVDTPLKDKGPEDIDFDVIRENTEDLYCGNGNLSLGLEGPSRIQGIDNNGAAIGAATTVATTTPSGMQNATSTKTRTMPAASPKQRHGPTPTVRYRPSIGKTMSMPTRMAT